jgi:hypothetical protein
MIVISYCCVRRGTCTPVPRTRLIATPNAVYSSAPHYHDPHHHVHNLHHHHAQPLYCTTVVEHQPVIEIAPTPQPVAVNKQQQPPPYFP